MAKRADGLGRLKRGFGGTKFMQTKGGMAGFIVN